MLIVGVFNARKEILNWIRKKADLQTKIALLIGFAFYTTIFILPAINKTSVIYESVKLIEYISLAIYLIKKRIKLKDLILPLALSMLLQSGLALAQWTKQETVGGLFYWLGERTFTASMPGIALVDLFGNLHLRPYATFPHPNVLGGFLAIGLLVLETVLLQALIKNWKKNKKIIIGLGACCMLGLLALFLTFSVSAIIAYLIGLGLIGLSILRIKKVKKSIKYTLIGTCITLICLSSILVWTKWSSPQWEKDQKIRSELNTIALKMFTDNPIQGKGMGNFIPNLLNYQSDTAQIRSLQPVHNIYLLLLAETGVIGISIFFYILIKSFHAYKKEGIASAKWIWCILLIQMLCIGLVDHYFVTLQQGQLMAVFILSLAFLPKNSYT